METNPHPGSQAPFVHRFATPGHWYAYDINTGRILEVPEPVWAIVEDVGRLSKEQLLAKHAAGLGADVVEAACRKIQQCQQQNLLLARRPEPIRLTETLETVTQAINTDCRMLVLCVSDACNLHCLYCMVRSADRCWPQPSDRMMSWETAQAAIDDFLAHSRPGPVDGNGTSHFVSFYGGEPLLNIRLMHRCVEYVLSKRPSDMTFGITTNGILLRGRTAEFLAHHHFDVNISLDGPRHVHDAWRRSKDGRGTWRQVMENIQGFVGLRDRLGSRGKLRILITLVPGTNAMDVSSFIDSHPVLSGLTIEIVPRYGYEAQVLGSDSARRLYREHVAQIQAGRVAADPEGRAWKVARGLFDREFSALHTRRVAAAGEVLKGGIGPRDCCLPGLNRTFVSTDGAYYPCERVPPVADLEIGDVHRGRCASRILELVQKYFHANAEECSGCWCVRNCRLGCLSNLWENGGPTDESKADLCRGYRQRMHEALVDYCRIREGSPGAFDYLSAARKPHGHE
jgi:uncharacterized protein